jgi:hypothetical protein
VALASFDLSQVGPSRLHGRSEGFWETYSHPIAVAPLAVVLLVALVFDPKESSWFWSFVVPAALGWFVFVSLYAMGVFICSFLSRCPRCGRRFELHAAHHSPLRDNLLHQMKRSGGETIRHPLMSRAE